MRKISEETFASTYMPEASGSQLRQSTSECVNRLLGETPFPRAFLLILSQPQQCDCESKPIELRAHSDKYFAPHERRASEIQFKFQIMFDFLVKRLYAIKRIFSLVGIRNIVASFACHSYSSFQLRRMCRDFFFARRAISYFSFFSQRTAQKWQTNRKALRRVDKRSRSSVESHRSSSSSFPSLPLVR